MSELTEFGLRKPEALEARPKACRVFGPNYVELTMPMPEIKLSPQDQASLDRMAANIARLEDERVLEEVSALEDKEDGR